MKSLFLLNICLSALSFVDQQPLLRAFPEAEGFGAATPGGRGGKVYFVRTLDDYIPGHQDPIPESFRFAFTHWTVAMDMSSGKKSAENIPVA